MKKQFFPTKEELLLPKQELVKEIKSLIEDKLSDDEELEILHKLEEIGIDYKFISKALKSVEDDKSIVSNSLTAYVKVRAKFFGKACKITPDDIISSINDQVAYFVGNTKTGIPTLYIKVKNNIPGKQSVDERITFFLYIIEKALELTKENNTDKFNVIYNRSDFDKDKHFDERLVKALSKYQDPKLGEIFAEWINNVYILNLGVMYKMMFDVYKLFSKHKHIDKVKILNNNNDLLKDYEKDSLPECCFTS